MAGKAEGSESILPMIPVGGSVSHPLTMRRHLSRDFVSVMAFPPISPVQAIQLGVAAQAVGSAAASAFSDMLRTAAELLAPSRQTQPAVPAAATTKSIGVTELSVLSGQIDSLLSQIADRVRQIFSAGNRQLPPAGLTLARDADGNVAVAGQGRDGSDLSGVLQQDGLLRSLLGSLDARRQLFGTATSSAEPGGPLQLHVDAVGARTFAG